LPAFIGDYDARSAREALASAAVDGLIVNAWHLLVRSIAPVNHGKGAPSVLDLFDARELLTRSALFEPTPTFSPYGGHFPPHYKKPP
jgi:hypothetical protein